LQLAVERFTSLLRSVAVLGRSLPLAAAEHRSPPPLETTTPTYREIGLDYYLFLFI
jgi:hypothetical protein